MSNSRKRRRALERMQARDGGNGKPDQFQLMKMAELISMGIALSQAESTPSDNHVNNGSHHHDFVVSNEPGPEPTPVKPADAEPTEAEAEGRKEAFRAIVGEFVEALKESCLAATGRDDRYVSRGMTYRWKLVQDTTTRRPIIITYKVVDDEFMRSMSVEMNSAGSVTSGPALLRSISERLREARESRAAIHAATTTTSTELQPRPTMAFRDYQLYAMRNACAFMGQSLMWMGEKPESDRVRLLAECIDVIDAGIAAIDATQ